MFVSHTSELRDFPLSGSYVTAVERAISACGHVIVDMADFPAADQPSAELCAERVRGCRVYVGVLGTRYGSPVRDRPEVSYTELEFDTATEAGLDRLVLLVARSPGLHAVRVVSTQMAPSAAINARIAGPLPGVCLLGSQPGVGCQSPCVRNRKAFGGIGEAWLPSASISHRVRPARVTRV